MEKLKPDGTKCIALSREHYQAIDGALQRFMTEIEPKLIVLSDASGLVAAQQGTLDSQAAMLLSTLAAGNLAAAGEMATLLDEQKGFSTQVHEGEKQSIFCTAVNETYLLLVVFDRQSTLESIRRSTADLCTEFCKLLKE